MFSKIDIHVNYQSEPKFWLVSEFSFIDVNDPDENPEEHGDSEDYTRKGDAIHYAVTRAEFLVETGKTESVTVFVNGNEHKTIERQAV